MTETVTAAGAPTEAGTVPRTTEAGVMLVAGQVTTVLAERECASEVPPVMRDEGSGRTRGNGRQTHELRLSVILVGKIPECLWHATIAAQIAGPLFFWGVLAQDLLQVQGCGSVDILVQEHSP